MILLSTARDLLKTLTRIKQAHISRGCIFNIHVNPLKPTGYVMHHQFNNEQLYALPTRYLCVFYLSENKERLVPKVTGFYNGDGKCLQRGTDWVFK